MFDWFNKFFKPPSSSETAKERLRLVLLSDHLSLAPEIVDALRADLIAVISKYVEVDASQCDVSFERKDASVAMLANIPILSMHNRRTPPPGGGGSGGERRDPPPIPPAPFPAGSSAIVAEPSARFAPTTEALAEAAAAESPASYVVSAQPGGVFPAAQVPPATVSAAVAASAHGSGPVESSAGGTSPAEGAPNEPPSAIASVNGTSPASAGSPEPNVAHAIAIPPQSARPKRRRRKNTGLPRTAPAQ